MWALNQILTSKVASINKDLIEELKPTKKGNKYKNKKVIVDGEEIDSIKEAKRYKELKLLLKVGELVFLARQVEFTFQIEGNKISSYFADFVYMERKKMKLIVEDVKSEQTRKLPAYRLKKKMMQAQNNIQIKEY